MRLYLEYTVFPMVFSKRLFAIEADETYMKHSVCFSVDLRNTDVFLESLNFLNF